MMRFQHCISCWTCGLVLLAAVVNLSTAADRRLAPRQDTHETKLKNHAQGPGPAWPEEGSSHYTDEYDENLEWSEEQRKLWLYFRFRPTVITQNTDQRTTQTFADGRPYTTVRRPASSPWRRPERRRPPRNIFRGRRQPYQRRRRRRPQRRPYRHSIPSNQVWPRFPAPAPTPPTSSPTFAETVRVSTDFSGATAGDPVFLVNLAEPSNEFDVDVSLPGDTSNRLYLFEETNVDLGTACPPPGGSLISTTPGQTFLSLSVEGSDQVLALCRDNAVVGVSYYKFEDFSTVGGSLADPNEFPDDFLEVIDFGEVHGSNPLTLQYEFGPGTELDGLGTVVLSTADQVSQGIRRLGLDAFYQAPPNTMVAIGDPCPLPGSQILPPDAIFPFSLFVLGGTENQVVFACDSDVVGVVDFVYSDQMTPAPTSSPTMVPTRSGVIGDSEEPSTMPSTIPSGTPSLAASEAPSQSFTPTESSNSPSLSPSSSNVPSLSSNSPSLSPSSSNVPSLSSNSPSLSPSSSSVPSGSFQPTSVASASPSSSLLPSSTPTDSAQPSLAQSNAPSASQQPTSVASGSPSFSSQPSTEPSASFLPSLLASASPSASQQPSSVASESPSFSSQPSIQPSASFLPSLLASASPSASQQPTSVASESPSFSSQPSIQPSASFLPSLLASASPSASQQPTSVASESPSFSSQPSIQPSSSLWPSGLPSSVPSGSFQPSESLVPTESSEVPSATPSSSSFPTLFPSISPSESRFPSAVPTETVYKPFDNRTELQAAVDSYLLDNAANTTVAETYGHPIGTWDVSAVTSMANLFQSASTFNEDIAMWNVSQVTDMTDMFLRAVVFNSPLQDWDVGSVTSMVGMFDSAIAFDQPLDAWNVASVTDFELTFGNATAYNQPLSSWTLSSGFIIMRDMFLDAVSYNQDLCAWGPQLNTNSSVDEMFTGAAACPIQTEPNLTASPPGPFCSVCV